MVAIATPYEDDYGTNPQTLCDWVKNFRIKKIQMKRKFRMGGGDKLRICAILSTALTSAEDELRRKQHERFNRWLELQAKLDRNRQPNGGKGENFKDGVDNCTKNGDDDDYVKPSDVAEECKRREEITKLWKYELSGLDEFMRNMSSNSSSNTSCNHIISHKNDCKEMRNGDSCRNTPPSVEVAS